MSLVVVNIGEHEPADLAGGAVSQGVHQQLDLVEALAARIRLVDGPVAVMAHVDIEVVQVLEDGLLAVLDGGRQLGEEQGTDGGVFVACVVSFQVAVRFLEGEQEAGVACLLDPAGDPLESDQQIILDTNSLTWARARAIGLETSVVTR